jgi:hypothetical protein
MKVIKLIRSAVVSCTVRTVIQSHKLCNIQYSLADRTVQFICILGIKVLTWQHVFENEDLALYRQGSFLFIVKENIQNWRV